MSTSPSPASIDPPAAPRWSRPIRALGAAGYASADAAATTLRYIGGIWLMVVQSAYWMWQGLTRRVRFGWPALYSQIVRLGVRSIGVITLVSACIGLILALQMSPPLADFGQTEKVANIIGIAVFRELGPLISAIVLTGFAGASIAAEIGTMAVNEEIEALEVHALNPVRFLVVPRLMATVISLIFLAVLGDLVAVTAGFAMGTLKLGIPPAIYYQNTLDQIDTTDFFTGLAKAAVFGLLIGCIACYNGMRVSGGAAGVGKATTNTVVHSIVSIIFMDLIFTAVFFALGWN